MMRRQRYVLVILFILIAVSAVFASGQAPIARVYHLPKGVSQQDYLPKTLIVKYKNIPLQGIKTFDNAGANKSAIRLNIVRKKPMFSFGDLSRKSLSDQNKIDQIGLNRIYQINYSDNLSIEKAINEVLKDTTVAYAEPYFIYHTFADPNDPAYVQGNQSYLNQVKASQAWTVQPNANGVIIAIVDSGSDLTHEDLQDNIYVNTADPINGKDDDGDGYVDNYYGWDFVGLSASNLVEDNDPDVKSDSCDHGIHVSGLASAVSNNGIGMASLAQTAKLMIIKAGSDDNASAIYRGYDGIVYAADHGANIINCSWGGAGGGAFGQDVINYVVGKGCLVVVAAGNSGSDEPIYPAAYDGVFAVSNVLSTDVKASSSSYGYHVAISSPGASIYSTINNSRYSYKSGTSMATPIVSSAAALVLAKNPNLNGIQAGEILRLNTDDIYSLAGNASYKNQLGSGRLNVYKALTAMLGPSIRKQNITINDHSAGSYAIGDTLNYYFDLKNLLVEANNIQVGLVSSDANISILTSPISTGVFAGSSTKTIGPFKVVVLSSTPDNHSVLFQLTYSNNASYSASEFFTTTLNLDYQNVKVNQVYTTVTSNGRVGYSGDAATDGLGFIYKDYDLLYEAGLMIGTDTSHISNHVRGVNGATDHDFIKSQRVAQISSSSADYEALAKETDGGASNPSPLNVLVTNRMIAYKNAPNDKYVLVEYVVTNKGTSILNHAYIGLFTDWDVDVSSQNIAKYDTGLQMGYIYATTPLSPFVGVKLLSTPASPMFYPMSYQVAGDFLADGNFTRKEKFLSLSSGVASTSLGSGNGIDVMFTIGSGPYTIPVNDSIKVAFAFIAGDNLTDISNSALAAQAKYNTVLTAISNHEVASGFVVSQNYPNPVKNQTQIEVAIPKNGLVNIDLYDLTGRKIANWYHQTLGAGNHYLSFPTQNLYSGIYFYQVSYKGRTVVKKMIVNP
ncbi:MAG: S8 family peptidase [Sphingobacteriales bacterium]|nr:S8 family peptidase [Sphingobacteriales bacterium]